MRGVQAGAERHRGGHRRERGATLVEAAIVFPILFLVLFGIIELGLAFKNDLSIGHSAREGARAGATFGNDINANYLVLKTVQATLGGAAQAAGTGVEVYNPASGAGDTYEFQPGYGGGCDWFPCPDPESLVYTPPTGWPPQSRDVSAPFTDRIGIRIEYTHDWLTNYFFDESDLTHDVEFQIEPQIFDP